MVRALISLTLLAFAPVMVARAVPASAEQSAQQCADTPQKQVRRSIFGSILGNLGGQLAGHSGAAGEIVAAALPATQYLSDELLKLLDCGEQQQAAKATDQAIRGGVGTESNWKSDSRANVSGSSKVTGQQELADGSQCLTVTDVVIVDGEETTVPKKMCRAKGADGYVRV